MKKPVVRKAKRKSKKKDLREIIVNDFYNFLVQTNKKYPDNCGFTHYIVFSVATKLLQDELCDRHVREIFEDAIEMRE